MSEGSTARTAALYNASLSCSLFVLSLFLHHSSGQRAILFLPKNSLSPLHLGEIRNRQILNGDNFWLFSVFEPKVHQFFRANPLAGEVGLLHELP